MVERIVFVVCAGLALLVHGRARVQRGQSVTDEDTPVNPFGAAISPREWSVLTGERVTKRNGAMIDWKRLTYRFWVEDLQRDRVLIRYVSLLDGQLDEQGMFQGARGHGLTLAQYAAMMGWPGLARLEMAPERRRVAEAGLACQKLNFTAGNEMGKMLGAAWFSARVRASGLAALETTWVSTEQDEVTEVRLEVAGWGTAEQSDWGRTLEEVERQGW